VHFANLTDQSDQDIGQPGRTSTMQRHSTAQHNKQLWQSEGGQQAVSSQPGTQPKSERIESNQLSCPNKDGCGPPHSPRITHGPRIKRTKIPTCSCRYYVTKAPIAHFHFPTPLRLALGAAISISISTPLATSKRRRRSCPTDPTGARAVPVLDMSTLS
jgi:hypothetical protein